MLIFVTNVWNHYMTSMCPHLAKILGGNNFRLILVSPTLEEPGISRRIAMGWEMDVPDETWIVPNPRTSQDLVKGPVIELIETAEVAIIESLFFNKKLFKAVARRIKSGKLTFIANERFFKRYVTMWEFLDPRSWWRWLWVHRRFSHPNVHYLPEDHWGKEDMRFHCACKGRIWQFGCFPPVSEAPVEKPSDGVFRIGWCGKISELKHVDHIIRAVASLPSAYRDKVHVDIVGEGDPKNALIGLAKELSVDGQVDFHPYLPLEKVKEWMETLDCYVFPSDRREGWGVVLAESMDKCCVPLACVEAGATLDLIDDGYNGFVFEEGDVRRIARKIMWLIDHPSECREMGLNAWKTMQERSADKAAAKCLAMIRAAQTGDYSLAPAEGPFSNIG